MIVRLAREAEEGVILERRTWPSQVERPEGLRRYTAAMESSARAVVFNPTDYASFGRRVLANIVDVGVMVIVFLSIQLGFALKYVPPDLRTMKKSQEQQKLVKKYMAPYASQIMLLSVASFAIYLVPISSLPGGTLGYRLARIRLIDHRGLPPSWWKLIKRLLIVGLIAIPCSMPFGAVTGKLGSSNPLIQGGAMIAGFFAWLMLLYRSCATHERRQAIHDRWVGTWMVRKGAAAMEGKAFDKAILVGPFLPRHPDVEPGRPTGAAIEPDAALPPITSDAR